MATSDISLNNPIWYALTNQQATLALGDELARCYPRDVAPFGAVNTQDDEAFRHLEALLAPDEVVALIGTPPDMQTRWTLVRELALVQMVYVGGAVPAPETSLTLTPLTEADVPAMLALVELTRPGPFMPRTIQLGQYLGIWQEGQLAAMAGERFHLPGYREISAVCTHPNFQQRGYARTLMQQLMHNMQADGDTPFLHVLRENINAQTLYAKLGFQKRADLPLFTVKRQAA